MSKKGMRYKKVNYERALLVLQDARIKDVPIDQFMRAVFSIEWDAVPKESKLHYRMAMSRILGAIRKFNGLEVRPMGAVIKYIGDKPIDAKQVRKRYTRGREGLARGELNLLDNTPEIQWAPPEISVEEIELQKRARGNRQ